MCGTPPTPPHPPPPPPLQMFVRGRPLEVTIPEGAGGGATMRIRLPRAASTEESAELEEPEGPDYKG